MKEQLTKIIESATISAEMHINSNSQFITIGDETVEISFDIDKTSVEAVCIPGDYYTPDYVEYEGLNECQINNLEVYDNDGDPIEISDELMNELIELIQENIIE